MAKQRGLHQIKGKVGEYSYYSQSGVSGGLIRSINQGMSERVKTSEEFGNTRKNNAEFGNAADTAKQMAKIIVPKYRPMFLLFSQAKLTQSLLRLIKTGNSAIWGQRSLGAADTAAMAQAISELSKNDPTELISVMQQSADGSSAAFNLVYAEGAQALLASWGASGVIIKVARYNVFSGNYLNETQGYAPGTFARIGGEEEKITYSDFIAGDTYEPTVPSGTSVPSITGRTGHAFNVVVVMPYRTIGGNDSILQEHCSFYVWETDFE